MLPWLLRKACKEALTVFFKRFPTRLMKSFKNADTQILVSLFLSARQNKWCHPQPQIRKRSPPEVGNRSRIPRQDLAGMRFELLNDPWAQALNFTEDWFKTLLKMWLFGQQSPRASSQGGLLCYGPTQVDCQLPHRALALGETGMLSVHLHFKHFLGAAQHFRRPENNREELQFQTSQASFHQELCSFVLVGDAAAECFGVQSWCWLLGQSLGAWGPAPA